MGGAAGFRLNLTGLVHDGNRAVAGIFDDLAFSDVDDGGTIGVAVPWHDAPRLNREFAEPELTLLDVCRFLFEIDGGEHRISHALARLGDRLTCIGFHLVGRATAGNRGRHTDQRRSSGDASQNHVSDEYSTTCDRMEHVRDLLY